MRFSALASVTSLGFLASCSTVGTDASSSLVTSVPAVVQNGGGQWADFALPPGGTGPAVITAGIRGQMWFTEDHGNSVDRLRIESGAITRFPLPKMDSFPLGIAAGPDSNLWFCEQVGRIGRMSPQGSLKAFPAGASPSEIASGADGNMWFTDPGNISIGKIAPEGSVTEYPIPSGATPVDIASGSDGRLWFTEDASRIGAITTDGTVTEYTTPTKTSGTVGITLGSDGDIWFTETSHRIGRATPSGDLTDYYIKGLNPGDLQSGGSGPDMFIMLAVAGLADYNTRTHRYTLLGFPPGTNGAGTLALGSDGNVWFTQFQNNAIAVFIRHVLTVSPTSLALQVGQTATLTASESGASGPLEAGTSNPAVATVASAGSNTFTVTAVGQGSATVTVRDHRNNDFPVPVIVH